MTADPKVQRVIDAWTVAGPQSEYHRKAQAFLRNQWPALAEALDALAAPVDGATCSGCLRQGTVIIADLLCPRHGIRGTHPEEAS